MFSFTKILRKIPKTFNLNKINYFNLSRIGYGSKSFKKEIILTSNLDSNEVSNENSIALTKKEIQKFITDKSSNKNLFVNPSHTEFNERLNSKKNEIDLAADISQKFYSEQFNSKEKKKIWVTHDAPTYTTGKPHLGMLYNKIIKDAVNRLKILQGHRVHYQIGFDCFGVNIEDLVMNLEKQRPIKDVEDLYTAKTEPDLVNNEHKKINQQQENILEIRKKCRKFVIDSIIEQIKYFLRMGIMFDVNSVYSTFNKNYETLELELFKELYEKGLVYRDYRVIFWSAEENRIVDYEDLEEKSELADCIAVKFPIKSFSGDSKFLEQEFAQKGKKIYLLGFLQEPWKYIGIRYLAINPNTTYCLAKIKDDYCISAYKRLPELSKRSGDKSPEILYSVKGSSLCDLLLIDPLFERELPVILDKDLSEFFGTGINIISPAHDFNSEKISRGYNLSLEGFLDEDNHFKPGLGLAFHNTHYSDGNYKIMTKLKSAKHLFANWKFENFYYANKLTEERIVLRSIPSWFMSIDKNLKNECIKELSLIHFYPELNFDKSISEKLRYQPAKLKKKKKKIEKLNKGYKNIIEEIDDLDEWCISEINSWGVPIPYFTYKSEYLNKDDKFQKEVIVNSEIIDHLKNLFALHGSDIWWKWTVEDLLPEKYKSEASKVNKGIENFDSLFDSSISWYVVLHNKLKNLTITDSSFINEEVLEALKKDSEYLKFNVQDNARDLLQNVSNDHENNTSLNYVENLDLDSIRTKEHLKDYNNQLRQFVIEEQNNFNKNSEKSEEDNSSEEDDSNDKKNYESSSNIENHKIQSLIPKNILYNHINFKCLNYSTSRLFPADILIEGNLQHTNWFIQSLMISVALSNQSCFRSIKTHGYIEDSSGNKLSNESKSFMDPLDIIDGTIKMDFERKYGYGADTVRLFLLKNESDTNFSLFEEFLEKSKSELKLIRKISKISLGLLNDFKETKGIENFSFSQCSILDQIMINEFIKFYSKLTVEIEKYNFKEYYNQLRSFTFDSFYDYYLTAVKNRILLKPCESIERRNSQFVVKEIFCNLVKLFSPIIPFTTEEIYKNMNFLSTKKIFVGLEDIPNLEEILEIFKFRFNDDYVFNIESLMMIRREISHEISKLSKSNKVAEIKRNQINLIFQIQNTESYVNKILTSLCGDINDFFGVNMVNITSEYQENEENVFLKSKTVHFTNFFSELNSQEKSKIDFEIKYIIEKSGMQKCIRCFNHRCKEVNKICATCQEDIKMILNPEDSKSIVNLE